MNRGALAVAALALAWLGSAALSEWRARKAWTADCAAIAIEELAVARRWAPWRPDLARELTRRALQQGDYARLAQTRGWWLDAGVGDPLWRAAQLENSDAGAPPREQELADACTRGPADCTLLRVAAARWQLRVAADHVAASAALGWSPGACVDAHCELPPPAQVEQALRLAWGYRSARGLVHEWLQRVPNGLGAEALPAWRLRAALDRNELQAAVALAPAQPDACVGPARAAENALLLASLRLRQERYDFARLEIDHAEAIALAAADPRGRARLLPYRAYLAMRQGRWEVAAEAFAELATSGGDRWEQRDGLAGLGNVRLHQGRVTEAAELYQRALELDDQLESGDPGFRLRLLSMQAQAALQQDDPDSALAPLTRARELAQARGDSAGEVTAWLASADYHHRRGESAAALQAIGAALALERSGQARRVSPFLSAQYEQALQRVHRLAQDADPMLRAQAIDALWALQWTMRRRPQRHVAQPLAIAAEDAAPAAVSARLDPRTHVLSYGYAGERSFVLWLDHQQLRLVELPLARGPLEELAARWMAQLRRAQQQPGAAARELPAALRAALIEPLWRAGLPRGGRLLVNPAGALATLPWAGLGGDDGSGWRHLVDEHELKLVAALDWLLAAPPTVNSPALVVAGADAPPMALEEARWVAEHLGVVVPRPELPEPALRAAATQAGWLHIAGHGVRNSGHPLDAYLQLAAADGASDGRWRVAEVLGDPLRATVVVLGACETSEAAQLPDWTWFPALDMATALVLAGAGEVVSSVLPAGDADTAELMRAFYRALDSGDATHALAQAQRDLARRLPPERWAGFRVSGIGVEGARQRAIGREFRKARPTLGP